MFYKNYLGILEEPRESTSVYICEQRDVPLNKHYIYRLILTDYDGVRVISASSTMDETFLREVAKKTRDMSLEQAYSILSKQESAYRVSYMYRMFQVETSSYSISLDQRFKIEYKAQYHKSITYLDGVVIGYCKISDVYFGYGNIVVWVEVL